MVQNTFSKRVWERTFVKTQTVFVLLLLEISKEFQRDNKGGLDRIFLAVGGEIWGFSSLNGVSGRPVAIYVGQDAGAPPIAGLVCIDRLGP